jgi:hypothetical protein
MELAFGIILTSGIGIYCNFVCCHYFFFLVKI